MKTVLLAGASLLAMTSHAWSFEMLGSLIISAMVAIPGGIAILPVASAAVIGQAVVGAALLAANIAASFMQRRPSINPGDFKNTFEDTGNQSEIRAIGRVRVGGLKVFGNTRGKDRYRLIAHTKGRWTGTEEHYLGGREVTVETDGSISSPPWTQPDGSWVYIYSKSGDGTETAWPQLQTAFPDLWSAHHRVRGIFQSLAHFISPGLDNEDQVKKFQLLYQNGEPQYEIVGRAEAVYDPRTVAVAWSDNAILGATHILRSFPSMSDSDFDFSSIGAEANRADASVATKTGAVARARAWGFWPSEAQRGDIMEQVLRSIGGEIIQTADNRYTIRLIDDARTADVEFTEKHIVGIEWRSGPESVERPNVCRVRYYSPERNYEMADVDLTGITWARAQIEIDRVGEQYYDVELPFCPSASQAQRIARRLFALARADVGTVTLNMAGLAAWGLSTASIYFPDIDETKICAIGTPRIDDEAGTVSFPFIVWPDLPPWNPVIDEAYAPEPIPDLQYPSELDTPTAPADAVQVVYPGGAREVRVLFSGVVGGTVAEATRRTYAAGIPQPWASMVEYQAGGQWYAFAAANYEGLDVDFRVRFFNEAEEGSYWSPQLARRPVTVNNLPPAGPGIEREDDGGIGPSYNFRFLVGPSLNVASTYLQYSDSPSGPWTLVASANSRPGDVSGWIVVPMPEGFGWIRYVRAVSFASNGVANTPSAVITVLGPTP